MMTCPTVLSLNATFLGAGEASLSEYFSVKFNVIISIQTINLNREVLLVKVSSRDTGLKKRKKNLVKTSHLLASYTYKTSREGPGLKLSKSWNHGYGPP